MVLCNFEMISHTDKKTELDNELVFNIKYLLGVNTTATCSQQSALVSYPTPLGQLCFPQISPGIQSLSELQSPSIKLHWCDGVQHPS